jgi:hypothetical protein
VVGRRVFGKHAPKQLLFEVAGFSVRSCHRAKLCKLDIIVYSSAIISSADLQGAKN